MVEFCEHSQLLLLKAHFFGWKEASTRRQTRSYHNSAMAEGRKPQVVAFRYTLSNLGNHNPPHSLLLFIQFCTEPSDIISDRS